MINLYLSDFILGIDNKNHNLSLNDIIHEFEKLFKKYQISKRIISLWLVKYIHLKIIKFVDIL